MRVLIVFFMSLGLLLSSSTQAKELTEQTDTSDKSNIYVNETYALSLKYPSTLEIKHYGDKSFVFVDGKVFLIACEIFDVEKWYATLHQFKKDGLSKDRLLEVVTDRAIAYCAADGPDGSYSCSHPEITTDYRSARNFRVLKFYLTGTASDYSKNTEVSSRVGPFYGVDISGQGKPRALLIRYKRGELASPEHESMLKDLVDSVELLKNKE